MKDSSSLHGSMQAAPAFDGGRVPPQALEAEKSVLGAMLLDKEAIGRATEILDAENFYRDSHRKVFECVTSLYERNESADLITVSEELRKRGHLESVGGAAFLSGLIDMVPTAANVIYHSELVLEKAVLRKLIEVATQIVRKGYEASDRSGDLIDQAEEMIFSINDPRMKRGFVSLKTLLPVAVDLIQEVYDQKRAVTGVPSGFLDLDKMTAGFQSSDLIIVAGRPSMGKTAFALNLAEYAAVGEAVPTGVFSLEMSKEQLVMRLLSSQARIPSHKLRTGYLRPEEWEALARAAGTLSEAPIFIDDTPAITVTEMRAKARRLKKEANLGTARGRLPAAGSRLLLGGVTAAGDLHDFAISQGAGQGTRDSRHRPLPAIPRRRTARRQAPDAFRLAGVRRDRAGRRLGVLHLPRGVLQTAERGSARIGRSHRRKAPQRPRGESGPDLHWRAGAIRVVLRSRRRRRLLSPPRRASKRRPVAPLAPPCLWGLPRHHPPVCRLMGSAPGRLDAVLAWG